MAVRILTVILGRQARSPQPNSGALCFCMVTTPFSEWCSPALPPASSRVSSRPPTTAQSASRHRVQPTLAFSRISTLSLVFDACLSRCPGCDCVISEGIAPRKVGSAPTHNDRSSTTTIEIIQRILPSFVSELPPESTSIPTPEKLRTRSPAYIERLQ